MSGILKMANTLRVVTGQAGGVRNALNHVPYVPSDVVIRRAAAQTARDAAVRSKQLKIAGGVFMGVVGLHGCFGHAYDIYDQRFTCTPDVDPSDLQDLYGSEDFMEIFSVLPIVVELMMRGGSFDDAGVVHTFGLGGPGALEVAMEFTEEEDEDGDLVHFNKYETFEDVLTLPFIGGITLWKMTANFGFNTLEDGSREVYHKGAEFYGLLPMMLIFYLHSYYVIWATEHHVNSVLFKNDTLSDTCDWEENQRKNMPMQILKELGFVSMNKSGANFEFALPDDVAETLGNKDDAAEEE